MENINWSDLSFGYMKTDYNVRCYYRDGKWGELEVSSSEIINIHMAATCLHYGQESFEGLKAFKGRDGKIRVFRMDENGKRMQSSSRGIKMAELPVEKFEEAIRKVVKLNERFVPPYESGAALYIRPLMIGLGAQVGVKPALEYMFMVFVTPVGPYFKGGFKPCFISGPERKEIFGRMRPSQLLRNSWQQLHHSAVSLYPAFYHEQEFAAVGNRYGPDGGTPSGSGRRNRCVR